MMDSPRAIHWAAMTVVPKAVLKAVQMAVRMAVRRVGQMAV